MRGGRKRRCKLPRMRAIAITLANLLPNLGKALAVNAQIPLAEVTEWGGPDSISVLAESLMQSGDQCFCRCRRGGIAAQMSEGVQHDIFQPALVGKPLDVFQSLPLNGDRSVHVA